eukprot:Nk52_evm3s612 gene=Nk52_evmTU3s612
MVHLYCTPSHAKTTSSSSSSSSLINNNNHHPLPLLNIGALPSAVDTAAWAARQRRDGGEEKKKEEEEKKEESTTPPTCSSFYEKLTCSKPGTNLKRVYVLSESFSGNGFQWVVSLTSIAENWMLMAQRALKMDAENEGSSVIIISTTVGGSSGSESTLVVNTLMNNPDLYFNHCRSTQRVGELIERGVVVEEKYKAIADTTYLHPCQLLVMGSLLKAVAQAANFDNTEMWKNVYGAWDSAIVHYLLGFAFGRFKPALYTRELTQARFALPVFGSTIGMAHLAAIEKDDGEEVHPEKCYGALMQKWPKPSDYNDIGTDRYDVDAGLKKLYTDAKEKLQDKFKTFLHLVYGEDDNGRITDLWNRSKPSEGENPRLEYPSLDWKSSSVAEVPGLISNPILTKWANLLTVEELNILVELQKDVAMHGKLKCLGLSCNMEAECYGNRLNDFHSWLFGDASEKEIVENLEQTIRFNKLTDKERDPNEFKHIKYLTEPLMSSFANGIGVHFIAKLYPNETEAVEDCTSGKTVRLEELRPFLVTNKATGLLLMNEICDYLDHLKTTKVDYMPYWLPQLNILIHERIGQGVYSSIHEPEMMPGNQDMLFDSGYTHHFKSSTDCRKKGEDKLEQITKIEQENKNSKNKYMVVVGGFISYAMSFYAQELYRNRLISLLPQNLEIIERSAA